MDLLEAQPMNRTPVQSEIAEPETVIHAEGLTRRFGDFLAVDQVSFQVQSGEVVGYLGRMARARPRPFGCCWGCSDPAMARLRF